MVARIPTYHFQSYKLQLPTVISRDLPLDGLQEVKLPMGFQFKRWTIKHSKNKNESLIKSLVSAIFNHLKCNSSIFGFYDLCFLFGLEKPIENSKCFKFESLKLESLHLNLKELIENGKFSMHYSIIKYFKTSARSFQLHFSQFYFELSNLKVSDFSFKKLLFLTVKKLTGARKIV